MQNRRTGPNVGIIVCVLPEVPGRSRFTDATLLLDNSFTQQDLPSCKLVLSPRLVSFARSGMPSTD